MKRSTQYKWASVVLLGSVLIGFNQCIKPMGGTNKSSLKFNESSSNTTSASVGVSKTVSVDAFSKTVYTVTRAKCMSCHDSGQTPFHASSNVTTAHDAILNSAKVDLNNPANSRMVLKLKNEKHNCWGDCTANAAEMEKQISAWKSLIGSSSTSTTSGKITGESETIYNLFNPSDSQNGAKVSLQTEGASLKSPMTTGFADGVSYIYVPETVAAKSLSNTDFGSAILNFKVTQADFYQIYMLVNAPVEATSGMYVKAAGSDYKDWTIGATTGFEWRKLTNTSSKLDVEFYMNANVNYTIELRQKNSGIKIAKVVMSNDPYFDPNGATTALSKATVSVSLANLTGINDAVLELDVEDFDQYSYKVSKPRIISSTPIKVKKLKVLLNKVFNPQHSSYLNIDKTATAADPVLSEYYMLMLKDKGESLDRISFEFESIEAVK